MFFFANETVPLELATSSCGLKLTLTLAPLVVLNVTTVVGHSSIGVISSVITSGQGLVLSLSLPNIGEIPAPRTTSSIDVVITLSGTFLINCSNNNSGTLVSSLIVDAPWTIAVIHLSPARPPIVSIRQVIATTSTISSTVSAAFGYPTIALQQSVILTYSAIAACVFSDVEQPDDTLSNILAWSIEPQIGSYYRGAAVGFLVVLGSATFGMSVAVVVTMLVRRRTLVKRLDPKLADASPGVPLLGLYYWSSGVLRYPGILVLPFVVFLDSGVSSAVSLLRLHLSSSDVALGVLLIIITLSAWIAITAASTRTFWFRCVVGPRHDEGFLPFELRSRAWQWLLSWLEWGAEWTVIVDDHPSPGAESGMNYFKRRFATIFESNKVSWFLSVDMSVVILQALVVGVRLNSIATCKAQSIVLLLISLYALVTAVYLMPCGARLDQLFLITGRIISVVCALLTVLALFSTVSTEAVDVVSSVGSLVGLVQSVIQVSFTAILIARWWHRRITRRSQKAAPGAHPQQDRRTQQTRLASGELKPVIGLTQTDDHDAMEMLSLPLVATSAEVPRNNSFSNSSSLSRSALLPRENSDVGHASSRQPSDLLLQGEDRGVWQGGRKQQTSRSDRPRATLEDDVGWYLKPTELADTSESILFMALPAKRCSTGVDGDDDDDYIL